MLGIYGMILFFGGIGKQTSKLEMDHWAVELIHFTLRDLSKLTPSIDGAFYVILTLAVLGLALFFQHLQQKLTTEESICRVT